jgi:tetratricopeptide (TPR) repeat protein
MVRPRVLVTALACIIAPALAPAARPTPAAQGIRRSQNLELWLSAVRGHVPGQADRAVTLIAPWTRQELEPLLARARSLPEVDGPLLKRAAVLHADIAVLHRSYRGYSLPSDGPSVDFVEDGMIVSRRSGTVHWGVGRRLLDLVEADDEVRLWYTATCAFLQSWGELSELETHLGRARARFPRDGVLLLYEGTLHAVYAEPSFQILLHPETGTYRLPQRIGDAKDEQKEAERRFEQALALDPDLTEARIRLAYVRGLLGRHEEAAADLRSAVARGLKGYIEYDAWLLLGREEEAVGRPAPARDAFMRAMELYPGAQSPHLGLSLLARAGGERAAARTALDLLSQKAPNGQDPWWSFDKRHDPSLDELYAQMLHGLAP